MWPLIGKRVAPNERLIVAEKNLDAPGALIIACLLGRSSDSSTHKLAVIWRHRVVPEVSRRAGGTLGAHIDKAANQGRRDDKWAHQARPAERREQGRAELAAICMVGERRA